MWLGGKTTTNKHRAGLCCIKQVANPYKDVLLFNTVAPKLIIYPQVQAAHRYALIRYTNRINVRNKYLLPSGVKYLIRAVCNDSVFDL